MNLKKQARRREALNRRLWKKNYGHLKYEVFRAELLNVADTMKSRVAIGSAALAAFMLLRRAGQKNASVTVRSDGVGGDSEVVDKTQRQAYAEFMRVANLCAIDMTPPAQMTDKQKFAIAMAAGVPIDNESDMNALVWKLRTRLPCAIQIEDGKYVVYQLPNSPAFLGCGRNKS